MSSDVPVASTSRMFAEVNEQLGPEHYEYDAFEPTWNSHEQYEVINRLGRGKYSEVFAAHDSKSHNKVVVKVLKPIKERKIKREIKILQELQKGGLEHNIVKLLDTVHDPETTTRALVFEFVPAVDLKLLSPTFTAGDVQYYMYELLKAMKFAHGQGIVHRDIKPLNILIEPSSRTLKLIDWGLAEFYHPHTALNCRVASRWYKSPEILLDYPFYDYSLDMWSWATTFGGIITQREPLFRGNDNFDQLVKIAKVLGSSDLWKFADKYNIEVSPSLEQAIGYHAKRSWSRAITPDNQHLMNKDAIDLLDKTLVYDHTKRLTAAEAMAHPYFASARVADEKRKKERKKGNKRVTAVFSPSGDIEQAEIVEIGSTTLKKL
ncbi:hypothetical protein ACM66B_006336 [Microbotryomycetes sp. NB124-2]